MSTDRNKLFWFWLKVFYLFGVSISMGKPTWMGRRTQKNFLTSHHELKFGSAAAPRLETSLPCCGRWYPASGCFWPCSPSPARALLTTHTTAHSQVYLAKGHGLVLISFRFYYYPLKISNMPVPTNWKLKWLNCWVCVFLTGFWFLLRSSMLCVMNKNTTIF